jgi:hypothetical protein
MGRGGDPPAGQVFRESSTSCSTISLCRRSGITGFFFFGLQERKLEVLPSKEPDTQNPLHPLTQVFLSEAEITANFLLVDS